jgi:ElaB/YqjD/DUF883 family membrane-anchored ribosome-binding protein
MTMVAIGHGNNEQAAGNASSHADERLREAVAHGGQQADGLLDRVTCYARGNPLMSIGIAFVAGVLYSSLTRRR